MTVAQFVNHFTNLNFDLVVLDIGYYGEVYNGPADEVDDDPVSSYLVLSIEPPKRAGEVIIHVDVDEYLDVDSYELFLTES